jgi:hypothetical protein
MCFYFVVFRQRVDLGGVEVNEDVMTEFNAMFIGRSGKALSLEVSPANQASIYVVIGERHRAGLLKIEVDQMTPDCPKVGALNYFLLHLAFHA